MMRVAVTRTLPEADETAARLRAVGFDAVVTPLMQVVPRPFDADLSGAQALLFTSINGLRAFAAASPQRDLPVLTVGDATAAAARDAGFHDVRSADGNLEGLAALAQRSLAPQAGKLVHIAGTHVAGDLVAALARAGYGAERRIAFDTIAVATLPPALAAPCDAVMFHSARAAHIYAAFGAPQANQRVAACLSQAIADAALVSPENRDLGRIAWRKLVVAARPREDALLQALLASSDASA